MGCTAQKGESWEEKSKKETSDSEREKAMIVGSIEQSSSSKITYYSMLATILVVRMSEHAAIVDRSGVAGSVAGGAHVGGVRGGWRGQRVVAGGRVRPRGSVGAGSGGDGRSIVAVRGEGMRVVIANRGCRSRCRSRRHRRCTAGVRPRRRGCGRLRLVRLLLLPRGTPTAARGNGGRGDGRARRERRVGGRGKARVRVQGRRRRRHARRRFDVPVAGGGGVPSRVGGSGCCCDRRGGEAVR